MKRILLYCVLLAAALMLPVHKIDVSDLEPIQAVQLYKEDNELIMRTDTKDKGSGENVRQALMDMKKKSEGIVYLDTAEFLLVSDEARDYIAHIKPYLKGKVRVCLWEGEGDLTKAAKYMKAHKTGVKLKKWNAETKLPVLSAELE